MPRYDRGMERHRMGMRDFGERGYDAGYGPRGRGIAWSRGAGGEYGGVRSDAGGTRWDRFPGEEGWLGGGYAGYPAGDVRGRRIRGWQEGPARYGTQYRDDLGSGYGGRGRSDADRIRAREIMTDDPECVTPDEKVVDVARKMRDLDVGIIPVVDDRENRRLRGVITDRDLAIRVLAEGKDGKARVGDFMTDFVGTVNMNDSVHDVLDLMKREQVRRVPVTDRENRLVGIIAQADLAVSYAGLDPQRETEVEEAIERISEPARPRRR